MTEPCRAQSCDGWGCLIVPLLIIILAGLIHVSKQVDRIYQATTQIQLRQIFP